VVYDSDEDDVRSVQPRMPPVFNGQNVEQFLEQFDLVCELKRLTGMRKKYCLNQMDPTRLRAVQDRLQELKASRVDGRVSWEDFKNMLLSMYGDPHVSRRAATKLTTLRQKGNETVPTFVRRFDAVWYKVRPADRPAPHSAVAAFVVGLADQEVYGRVLVPDGSDPTKQWESYQAVRDAALAWFHALQQKRKAPEDGGRPPKKFKGDLHTDRPRNNDRQGGFRGGSRARGFRGRGRGGRGGPGRGDRPRGDQGPGPTHQQRPACGIEHTDVRQALGLDFLLDGRVVGTRGFDVMHVLPICRASV
jgi:hypothetical protein